VTPFLVSGSLPDLAAAAPLAAASHGSSAVRAQHVLIAEAKSPDKNPAICGVRLLQLIFTNLRRSQLALAPQLKNTAKPLLLADATPSSSVDPLYIHPVERQQPRDSKDLFSLDALNAKSRPQSGIAPTNMGKFIRTAADNRYAANSAGLNQPASISQSPNQNQQASYNAARQVANNVSAHAKRAVRAANPSAEPYGDAFSTQPAAPAGAPALGIAPGYQGMSPDNARRLTNSIARIFRTTKQMSELTSDEAQSSIKTYGGLAGASNKAADQNANTQLIASQPLIKEYRPSTALVTSNFQSLQRTRGADLTPMAETASSQTQGIDARMDDQDKETSQALQPNQPGLYKNIRTALLPPNVVGGIPAARLGATSQELERSLKTHVFRQKVDDWTVWTVPADGDSPAVQLFMRRGVLEAIRVFSQPYLGPDVGVQIGQDLVAVKQRFGEPELLLPEPDLTGHATMSQNYIYPLSHVAFQLTRTKSHAAPQVVSVLIFDVQ
jgi:hypothetical protein